MLRIILLILNVSSLIWISYVTMIDGIKNMESGFLLIGMSAFLLGNIYFIYINHSHQKNRTWIGLYFKRKGMEEKIKIEELKSKKI